MEKQLVEMKARCADLDAARAALRGNATYEATLHQVDTYYVVPRGRLKLRETSVAAQATRTPTREGATLGAPARQLIFYERADVAAVKDSRVLIAPIADSAALGTLLEAALGVRAHVAKVREVWQWEEVQVHLDTLPALGTFLELELPVDTPARIGKATEHVRGLLARLGVAPDDLVSQSYGDLVG